MEYICGITFAPFVIFHYPDDEEELYVKRVIGLPGLCAEWSAANSAVGRNLLYGICDNVGR